MRPGRPLAALALAVAAALSAAAEQREVVWLRDNTAREGVVIRVTDDSVTLRDDQSEITLPLADVRPDIAHRLLRARLSDNDAAGWYRLGEFALKNGLHAEALQAFNRVVDLDPKQKATLEPKIDEVRAADAESIFARARALAAEDKFEDALRTYSVLLNKYPASGHAAQAKDELKALAERIQRANDERQKRLAAAQQAAQDQRAQADDAADAARLTRALKAYEEGQKAFAEGLDQEGRGVSGRARKAWEASVAKLEESRAALLDLQTKAKTPAVQDAAKREVATVTRILIAVYDSLGQMEAVDQSFRDAVRWFNKALALDAADKVATDLKARITAEQIARRIRVGY